MCTVTRPGLAAIASATAVELMTSVLQHPKGYVLSTMLGLTRVFAADCTFRSMHAPAELKQTAGSVLGAVPHQIRGALSDFTQLKITGQAYKNCTACSDKVRDSFYRALTCAHTDLRIVSGC